MAAKNVIFDVGQTNWTIYSIIQNSVGSYYDDLDGTFKVSPTTPYVSLTEDTLILGRYANRNFGTSASWADGLYLAALYSQVGGSPDLNNDNLIGSVKIFIRNDVQIDIDVLALESSLYSVTNANAFMLKSLIRSSVFEYKGSASNTFSISVGSFIGSIKFYTIPLADFASDPNNPSFSNQICTLTSANEMQDTTDIAVDGEVIFLTLVGFEALENTIIEYYNDVSKATKKFFIPKYSVTVSTNNPYYPTVFGTLLTSVPGGSFVAPLTDIYVNENISNLSDIDFDQIVQPVVVDSSEVIVID